MCSGLCVSLPVAASIPTACVPPAPAGLVCARPVSFLYSRVQRVACVCLCLSLPPSPLRACPRRQQGWRPPYHYPPCTRSTPAHSHQAPPLVHGHPAPRASSGAVHYHPPACAVDPPPPLRVTARPGGPPAQAAFSRGLQTGEQRPLHATANTHPPSPALHRSVVPSEACFVSRPTYSHCTPCPAHFPMHVAL